MTRERYPQALPTDPALLEARAHGVGLMTPLVCLDLSIPRLIQRLAEMVMLGLTRGRISEGEARNQAMTWLIESVKPCAAFARDLGVRIVIEPINRFQTDLILSTQDGLAFLEQIGYDNVGLVLDTSHLNIEDKRIEASIRSAKGRLFHFHVSDSNRGYPGAGHIDFASVIRTIREIGYAGFVSGEFTSLPDAETAARRAIDHLRPLLRQV